MESDKKCWYCKKSFIKEVTFEPGKEEGVTFESATEIDLHNVVLYDRDNVHKEI
jgi:hypothetical protein